MTLIFNCVMTQSAPVLLAVNFVLENYWLREMLNRNFLVAILLAHTCGSAVAENSIGLALTLKIGSVNGALQEDGVAAKTPGRLSAKRPSESEVVVTDKEFTDEVKRPLRHIQFSEDQIIVVVINTSGEEVYRTAELDPRLIRAEVPVGDGQAMSQEYYLNAAVDLSLSIPQLPDASVLRLLKPIWNGSEFSFESLAEIDLTTL